MEPAEAARPSSSVSVDWLEVVLLEVVGDLLAELGSLLVGGAEMDAGPHSGVDDLFERVREPAEAPRGTGFVAEGAEGDFVGVEEVLERVRERSGRGAMARGVVGEGRRQERRRVEDRCAGSNSGNHIGSASVAGLPSVSASRIAVIGRQNCQ